MKATHYKSSGVAERRVEIALARLIEYDADTKTGRKKAFRRIKILSPKSLVAYYVAARIHGDLQLGAAVRDRIFKSTLLAA